MANYHGKNGLVYKGAVKVAEVTSFDYDVDARAVEDTECGDTGATYAAGIPDGTGRISCMWDHTDTTAQKLLRQGSSLTITLYPTGTTAGNVQLSGTVLFTRHRITQSLTDMVRAEFEFKGVLAETVISE
jgi:hypothetical protein